LAAIAKDPTADSDHWLIVQLKDTLHALPDIVDAKKKPIAITPEFLEEVSVRNLKSLMEAINGDLYPKSEGEKSPNG
jgi:hypothetical protein